jgi:hypothetical protein
VGSLDHEAIDMPAPTPAPNVIANVPVAGSKPLEDESMDRVIRVLGELQHRDPSRYVRLRSAAALRQIGPREAQ